MEALLYVLKKLASRLLFPVGLVLGLGALGAGLWLARPRRRIGPALVITAGLFLFALSSPWLSGALLTSLERLAGPYAQPAELQRLGVRQIVVLSGSQRAAGLTPADRCGDSTTLRLLEGIRLWKGLPGATLVLSGGSFHQEEPAARAMAELALQMGVPARSIRQETASWDTQAQARNLADKLGQAPFALVTSASHMFRARRIFQSQGLRPVAAPADFHHSSREQVDFMMYLPQAAGLALAERAIYEYLGIAYFEIGSLLGWAVPAGRENQ
ncbi:hypothetical protein AAU61_12495 [Desulfocarbo indianensis]|nr:hypothetical protein AAU61_12495 [Desulfocarbo indianensis]